jgi:hypothetical protein
MHPCSLLPPNPSHAQIVRDYVARYRPVFQAELAHFSKTQPLQAAIMQAASAQGADGKRLSHQRRLLKGVIPQASMRLFRVASTLASAPDFASLHDVIETHLMGVRGVGNVYVYDTALRLGAFLGKSPTKVYLHAGSREGAKQILGPRAPMRASVSIFPPPFRNLHPHELENLLCLYRQCL